MSEVKRYNTELEKDGGLGLPSLTMRSSSIGSWVEYKDYSALEAKCAALAAENAALKSFGGKLAEMHNDLNGEGTGIQGRAEVAIQQVALEAAMEEFDAIKTPATDAFLAEVRAQGVEMFAERKNKEMMSLHPDTHAVGSIAAEMSSQVKQLREFAAQLRKGGAA